MTDSDWAELNQIVYEGDRTERGRTYLRALAAGVAALTATPPREPCAAFCGFCGEPLHAVDTYCCPGCGWKVPATTTVTHAKQ